MEDEPLDIAVMEPFAQAVEGARDVVIALRGAMGLQDVPLESLDIALNLRSEKLIGPLGKVIEGFSEPSIFRPVADGNLSDGLSRLFVVIDHEEVRRRALLRAQLAPLVQLAVANHATRAVIFPRRDAFAIENPLANRIRLAVTRERSPF
jgi:hypothetical protein